MLRRLGSLLVIRRVANDLHAITIALDRQNALLTRLADAFAPAPIEPDRATVREDTGATFLDPTDAGLAIDYVEKTLRDTGHLPDEDEILIYLADEKTTDLHKRLVERDVELERLQAGRR